MITWLCANPANVQEADLGVGGRGWGDPAEGLWDTELWNSAVQLRGGTKGAGGRFCVWGVPKILPWSKQRLSSYLGWDTLPHPLSTKPHASGFYLSFTSQNISCGCRAFGRPRRCCWWESDDASVYTQFCGSGCSTRPTNTTMLSSSQTSPLLSWSVVVLVVLVVVVVLVFILFFC